MKSKRYAMTIPCLVVVVGAALCATGPAPGPQALPDPATMHLEYRPGVYFPEGFPLHGEVKLLSAPIAEMGKRTRVRVEYVVGDLAIEEGMRLELWKHFTSDVEEFQVSHPDEPAYFSVDITAPGVETETHTFGNYIHRNTPNVFPYRKAAGVTIHKGRLKQGDKVLFDLGGPLGVAMQTWQENLFNFRVVIVRAEDGKVLGYGGDAIMKITGGPLHKLTVQAPAIVALGEGFTVEVVPQDKFGSLAKNHQGLKLRIMSENVGGSALEYEPELLHYVAHNVVANAEGILRIEVETEDGAFHSVSNPIWVERHPLRRVFYGDLHQHTYMADGRGIPEELYLYARRVALLDFGAVSPHKEGMTWGPNYKLEDLRFPRDRWPDLVRANKIMNGWKDFVSILGYEYGGGAAGGGHHNIYYIDDDAPTTMQLDPNDRGKLIAKMLEILKRARRRALVIPHIGGAGPAHWKHLTDQRIERLFEIASCHGVFEEAWQKHLEAGVRLGVIAGGDNHMTSFGYANPALGYIMTNGLTGVYAYEKTRDDIWNALYEKRTFAVTGHARVLVDFQVNGEPMGGKLASTHAATAKIRAKVSGTAPLVRIDLLKNSKVIHSVNPARNRGNLLRVSWGDGLYSRRANTGLANGQLKATGGKLLLQRVMHLDNSFEHIEQSGDAITWTTAATSNDREAVLVDLSEVQGDSLSFHLDDPTGFRTLDVEIPLAQLKRDGFFSWSTEAPEGVTAYKKDYMKMMGVEPQFFLDCELVSDQHPMDYELLYEDRNPPKPGDYYYVRVEQLDTNRAWSSPVWVN